MFLKNFLEKIIFLARQKMKIIFSKQGPFYFLKIQLLECMQLCRYKLIQGRNDTSVFPFFHFEAVRQWLPLWIFYFVNEKSLATQCPFKKQQKISLILLKSKKYFYVSLKGNYRLQLFIFKHCSELVKVVKWGRVGSPVSESEDILLMTCVIKKMLKLFCSSFHPYILFGNML